MKSTSTFKLTKRTKTLLALLAFKDNEQRGAFKRMMIDAQMASAIVVRGSKDKDNR